MKSIGMEAVNWMESTDWPEDVTISGSVFAGALPEHVTVTFNTTEGPKHYCLWGATTSGTEGAACLLLKRLDAIPEWY